jgi:hypothetical protein
MLFVDGRLGEDLVDGVQEMTAEDAHAPPTALAELDEVVDEYIVAG